ncbi:hypothetical protein F544_17750 [Bibersteinia trehalosi USDA-ARS-USMARC-190]|uniref:Uncharacterized protein n=1 Tax=Bibersteinia trehalosi USDA-ARS-USMARC-190 TaxID=1263832 RepID=W0RC85_BIBTR|nr:hypothetical protein F544_17750 [Bibersteinia trehalosi USDA-ARS-USMARC-190]
MIQAVKNDQFSAEYAYLYFDIANSGIISQWLHAFDKQGINGLLPKPKACPSMKPQYPKMLPPKNRRRTLALSHFRTENEMLFYRAV